MTTCTSWKTLLKNPLTFTFFIDKEVHKAQFNDIKMPKP